MMHLLTLSLAFAAPEAPPAPGAQVFEVPRYVMKHCLYGVDPHSNAVRIRSRGTKGYRVTPRRFSPLDYLGQRTLTVVSVNGMPIGTAQTLFEAYKQSYRSDECTLVTEDGTTFVIKLIGAVDPFTAKQRLLEALSDPFDAGSLASRAIAWSEAQVPAGRQSPINEAKERLSEEEIAHQLRQLLSGETEELVWKTPNAEVRLKAEGDAIKLLPPSAKPSKQPGVAPSGTDANREGDQ